METPLHPSNNPRHQRPSSIAFGPSWTPLAGRASRPRLGGLRQAHPGGPQHALDYLARYTYKTVLSNERLRGLEHDTVRFAWRDRARGNRRKLMQLPAEVFLERFALHVLPARFMRIRHIGLLANRHKRSLLHQATVALNISTPQPPQLESVHAFCLRVLHLDITLCPICGIGRLHLLATITPAHPQRAPP